MKCATCKQDKPDDGFNWKNKALGQRKVSCRECDRATKKRFYEKHRERVIAENRQRNSDRRNIFKEWKSNLSCCLCGENEEACLDFHHVDPAEKDSTISELVNSLSFEKIKDELTKCVVVCRNCHAKIHKYNLEVPKAGVVFNG